MRFTFFIIGIFYIWSVQAQQPIGFQLPKGHESVTIPFRLINNLIVIPVGINETIKLNFIVDTGASTSILTEKVFADLIDMEYDRTILISGTGIMDSIRSYVGGNITLTLPGGITGRQMPLLVLEEDYIQLKENTGEDIFGIIGYDIFSRFVVKIDYDEMQMTLIEPTSFNGSSMRSYEVLDMPLQNSKPFVNAIVTQDGENDTLKLMIDTGASHALLLDIHVSESLHYPDSTIRVALGHGLGGLIPGSIGRFEKFQLADFELDDILVSIPDAGGYSRTIKRGSRNGTLGGNLLYHFELIFAYYERKLYIKKSRSFGESFEYNMSGMTLALKEAPERIVITDIFENSPADKAGLKEGMIIKSVNFKSLKNSTLSDIYGMLRSREGRKLRIKVYTDDGKKTAKYKLRLQRLI